MLLNAPGNASNHLWYDLFPKRALGKKACVLSRWNSVILAANQMSSSKVLRSLSQAALSYYRCLFIQNKITVTSLFTVQVNSIPRARLLVDQSLRLWHCTLSKCEHFQGPKETIDPLISSNKPTIKYVVWMKSVIANVFHTRVRIMNPQTWKLVRAVIILLA